MAIVLCNISPKRCSFAKSGHTVWKCEWHIGRVKQSILSPENRSSKPIIVKYFQQLCYIKGRKNWFNSKKVWKTENELVKALILLQIWNTFSPNEMNQIFDQKIDLLHRRGRFTFSKLESMESLTSLLRFTVEITHPFLWCSNWPLCQLYQNHFFCKTIYSFHKRDTK